jgi:hypothetical protein
MDGLGMEDVRELGKQRVGDGRRRLADGHRADLDALRVPVGLAAQGVGQQLMAVADAEHRLAGSHHPGQPARGGLAPGGPVGHHGAGAGDDGGGDLAGIGQAMCIKTGIDDRTGASPSAAAIQVSKPPLRAARSGMVSPSLTMSRGNTFGVSGWFRPFCSGCGAHR